MWNLGLSDIVAERFQVITVLMKSTQREQTLCQAAGAQVASVCLFCGDEVSRQQYRRWDSTLVSSADNGINTV